MPGSSKRVSGFIYEYSEVEFTVFRIIIFIYNIMTYKEKSNKKPGIISSVFFKNN